ncbi:unnamed protein product [Zymoseptoria tritici ST99CH_1A5]|uniref:Uncharacterized protein n=2 Tax=Zymoseptoria tritici TaxID=1047171 RepID=A0A2H1GPL6_ZYMTR|nr:unnamed protein product [Zymoseptoria tritici ST99CH_1E4]SMR57815.1 unnamed protein product [Zymoseptoria tritici ST99CH_3D1]SMY26250.1 unnamed protein product [Zymoseptoria tritici ST99CH_1A5]
MPTNLDIEKCLRRTVLRLWDDWDPEAKFDIDIVREEAEKTLGVGKGYFIDDLFWNVKSKTIILAAADVLWCSSEKSPPQSADCFLLGLPLEIQNMIFKMAFVTSHTILRTISIVGWAESQAESTEDDIRDEYGQCELETFPRIGSFPPLQVEKFLVSKAFFETAAKAYVQDQWIDLSSSRVFSGRTIAEQPRSILCRWATKIHISASWSVHANVLSSEHFRSLKWLKVKVHPSHFRSRHDVFEEDPDEDAFQRGEALDVILSDAQILWCDVAHDLGGIRGLNSIKLLTATDEELTAFVSTKLGKLYVDRTLESLTPAETKTWQSNLERLEELVKAQVTQPNTVAVAKLRSREDPDDWEYHCFGREMTVERYINSARRSWA